MTEMEWIVFCPQVAVVIFAGWLYIKRARESEATAEQLRLMIADTRKGVQIQAPGRRSKRVEAIDVESAPGTPAPDGLPIPRPAEPELLAGGHAQFASEAQRACARLRDWYAGQSRKAAVTTWSDERKRVLVADLQPLIKEMHGIIEIVDALTNAEGIAQ